MTTPYWVQDAVFYQIFPDRFANGDPSNDPPEVAKWGSWPTVHGFQGGDFRGIIQRFDYLLDLGITAIYLNPIFVSPATHRYHTVDYFQIDPKLGDMADFRAMLDVAHRNSVRIILDGVFNHCGRGFFAFSDVMENGAHSPYKDWFHIHRFPVEAYSHGDSHNYATWWDYKALPKFNTGNPAVRKFLFDVARYWLQQGADGWRLDVPNEIDDDTFWEEFRQITKAVNRDAYLVGEIWDGDPRWVGDSHFDGLMHYPLRDALLACLTGKENAAQFADKVEGFLEKYERDVVQSMYLPLGSHDTERIATALGELDKVRLAFLFQFAYPGAPAIYYGDEVGLEGKGDPDSRRAFPWDPADWKADLRPFIQNLIAIRKTRPSLRRGDFSRLAADPATGLYAFARTLGPERTVVVLNLSELPLEASIPLKQLIPTNQPLRSLLDNRPLSPSDGEFAISLKPWSGAYIGG
jgi:cyclomaltodextrinase / maltogenic alpha-amylase / neopullulanase